jgi:rhamnulokinase
MNTKTNFLAVDLGASSGRILLARWDGARFELQELHRFGNGPISIHGHLYWDVLQLWNEVKVGLARFASQFDEPLAAMGVDTWGVDFALLDRSGQLLGNPSHYRDSRTDGMVDLAFRRVPRSEIFEETGIQFMQLNTLFQVLSMVEAQDPRLESAETLLMMPDLFHYWLAGEKSVEYTIATTSQMLRCRDRCWAKDLLKRFGIPGHFLLPPVEPGTRVGHLRSEILSETGLRHAAPVISPASHDTASAVAAIPGLGPDSAYISSGTWSLMGVEIRQPIINTQSLEMNFTNEGGVDGTFRFLKNIAGLWLLQESRRQWQREGHDYTWDELLEMAGKAKPFLNLINPDAAEFLSPGNMPEAVRMFCQRTGQPGPDSDGAVVRCCLESLALRYRWVLGALENLTGRKLQVVRVVGGGSQNRLLCQWAADACDRSVMSGPVEATALGNVMVQAIATGHLSNMEEGRQSIAASVDQQYYEPAHSAAWDDAYGRFCSLIQSP